jgi:hypothetical protein
MGTFPNVSKASARAVAGNVNKSVTPNVLARSFMFNLRMNRLVHRWPSALAGL